MQIKELTIDIFEWDIAFIFLDSKDKNINKIGKKYNLLKEDIIEVNENLKDKILGAGLTLTNFTRKRTIVIVYPSVNNKDRLNTTSHEVRHTVDRITEFSDVNDNETSAYMTGYIMGELLTEIIQ